MYYYISIIPYFFNWKPHCKIYSSQIKDVYAFKFASNGGFVLGYLTYFEENTHNIVFYYM